MRSQRSRANLDYRDSDNSFAFLALGSRLQHIRRVWKVNLFFVLQAGTGYQPWCRVLFMDLPSGSLAPCGYTLDDSLHFGQGWGFRIPAEGDFGGVRGVRGSLSQQLR